MVILVVGEVYGAAALLFAGGDDRLVHVMAVETLSAVLGDERGMDVHHTPLILWRNEIELEKSGHQYEVDARASKVTSNSAAEFFIAIEIFPSNHASGYEPLSGSNEAVGLRTR